MKKKLRRRKIANKRHFQKSLKDSIKPKILTFGEQKEMERLNLVSLIKMREDLIITDKTYVKEDTDKLSSYKKMGIVLAIILSVPCLYVGFNIIFEGYKDIKLIVIFSILAICSIPWIPYLIVKEESWKWKDYLKKDLKYLKELKLRLQHLNNMETC